MTLFRKFIPIIIILILSSLIFFKSFTKGYFPIPGDLLVSFYFPWYSGSWQGYDPWTTHKELINADSIRQIYLWKEFAANQFKSFQFPLWNPYTFSGQPLLANFQSSVFYPFNLFYFLTSARNAWLLLIMIQPVLGAVFMYVLLKSFKLSKTSSIFGATVFIFSSYFISWLENGNITHSYLWLPLAFLAINGFLKSQKYRYLFLLTLSLAMSILAGHPQTAIYIFIATGIFSFYKIISEKHEKITIVYIGISMALALTLSAIQIVPSITFYQESPISLPFAKEVFLRSILPIQNLITFFASDFFGNPANNNYWNFSYGDFTPYMGVVPLIFALWAIFNLWKNKLTKFLTLFSVFFILTAVKGPLTFAIAKLNLPLFDSTTPSRFISLSIFTLAVLSAMGVDDVLKNIKSKSYLNRLLIFLAFLSIVYVFMWLFAILAIHYLNPKDVWLVNLHVTKRNLILPTFMFTALVIYIFAIKTFLIKWKYSQSLLVISIFFITLLGGIYYSNKFLPTAPKKFIFPDHLVFNWLKDNAGVNRFYGEETAHIDLNFATHYMVYGVEGYDTLRLKKYAELLAASFSGRVPPSYLRSDAVVPNLPSDNRNRLFDLLGVKYLLDKEDDPKNQNDFIDSKFAPDKVEGKWQSGKFLIYERQTVLPRFFMTHEYKIAGDKEIISQIYNKNYDLKTVLLEESPELTIDSSDSNIIIPSLSKYSPNEVSFKTDDPQNALLYLSDAYSPDWKVDIDGNPAKLLRADYALRAVAVPKGEHQVIMQYRPKSYFIGLLITVVSMVAITTLCLFLKIKKKF